MWTKVGGQRNALYHHLWKVCEAAKGFVTPQVNIEQRQKIVFLLSLFSVTRLDPVQDPDPSDVIVSESYNF